ncbi:DMT family transporter [Actinomycetospora aeridis]|uniref:SMR family transporter n=1 Tax=Actinomycetospora aeridis TaxID=3129231 RepID=A0ABU8NB80_9PSEU
MTETVLLAGSVATQGLCLAAMRAADGLRRPGWVVVAFGAMAVSVLLMARAMALGMPLAVAYGVWSGAGIALGAATGVLVFRDRLRPVHVAGLVLVLGGVLLVHGL